MLSPRRAWEARELLVRLRELASCARSRERWSRRLGSPHGCACERNSLKQFTKEAETARSPYNRSVIGAPIGETQ
jgi:hypothetical protein